MNEQPTGPIRVMIADDEPMVREALTEYLASAPDIEVIGTLPPAARPSSRRWRRLPT